MKILNPGQTENIGSPDWLIQIQNKGDVVDIVDHADKGKDPVDVHIVTKISKSGKITFDW